MGKKTFALLLVGTGVIIGVLLTVGTAYLVSQRFLSSQGTMVQRIANRVTGRLQKADDEVRTAKSGYDRWLALTDLVLLEAESRDDGVVRPHAMEVLQTAESYRTDWNYGNAIHKGNLALGRLALRQNRVSEANEYLLRAGRTLGSPQLDSFGPNMTLAKELYEHGERRSLLTYFELCGHFWELNRGKLREWSALVREGVEPDFGANLLY